MDVREKLEDIVCDATQIDGCIHSCNYPPCAMVRGIVDALIANGVTVQECGRWIYEFNLAGSNFYRCSVCDRQETLLEKEDIYEYCPFCHCGAKMIAYPPKGE